jgi:protein TonB
MAVVAARVTLINNLWEKPSMSATTINTFPSMHSWSSPRSWALAIIVLLHLGFFWALTNGMSVSIPRFLQPEPPVLLPVDPQPTPPKPTKVIDHPVDLVKQRLTYVEPEPLDLPEIDEGVIAPYVPEPTPPGRFEGTGDVSPPAPVVVEPRIDSRRGLSEPFYPPAEIRQGHEGTVVLMLHILADGRVGEVKLERSSGFAKLDESAIREAKRWRFVPGTSDGSPRAMWKQVPITFRLNTVTR